jgi:arylsulfatase A-like enzyme
MIVRRWAGRRAGWAMAALAVLAGAHGCRRAAPVPSAQRLVDLYRPEQLEGSASRPPAPAAVVFRFDGPAPPPDPAAAADPLTRGWRPLHGVTGLAVRNGRLAGRSTNDLPILHFERPAGARDKDLIHEVELQVKASAGRNVAVWFSDAEKVDAAEVVENARAFPSSFTTPLVAGADMRTHTMRSALTANADARHVFVRPTDVAGATFEIESLRVVSRREHLAGVPSGVGWHGLSEIYRETIVSRAPEVLRVPVRLPEKPRFDLAVGTIEHEPVTFRVAVRAADRPARDDVVVLERTVTRPHRWETTPVGLDRFAGQAVILSLALSSAQPNTLGFWGGPAVRRTEAPPPPAAARAPARPARGVVLVWADTLRRDHMSVYGYGRPTTPVLDRLAAEGVLFRDGVGQATWTKVATPSLLTSLYPLTHGVTDFSHRVPAGATTLAEAYRQAGFATASFSSVIFTGRFSNLHQGFEEVHEDTSLSDRGSSKTAREYVDRLLPWLEAHRDVPFFVFLHVTDPHDPYKPQPPYDTMWTDAGKADEHERQAKEVRKFIADPLLKLFGVPTRDEVVKAKLDPEAYSEHDRGWYDGSIRGLDTEIGRIVERLRGLGLDGSTTLAFVADHGEEFFEHGRGFHGQSTYGELSNMPFILWGPGSVPAGIVVEPTVQQVDVMPTLLELSGLPVPEAAQGRSLLPLFAPNATPAAARAAAARPAFVTKALTTEPDGPPPRETESFAIVSAGWKLIHNTKPAAGRPEFELYEHGRDPLDARDVAASHPERVRDLGRELAAWRQFAERARLKPDSEANQKLSQQELERLRSLGYIQ